MRVLLALCLCARKQVFSLFPKKKLNPKEEAQSSACAAKMRRGHNMNCTCYFLGLFSFLYVSFAKSVFCMIFVSFCV